MAPPVSAILKLGKKIAEIRSIRNMTQEELSLEAGFNRAYVGYIERGERVPTIKTLVKLAQTLNVELFELFKF